MMSSCCIMKGLLKAVILKVCQIRISLYLHFEDFKSIQLADFVTDEIALISQFSNF